MKLLVADSDHMIPFRQPGLVIGTIAEVCELVEAQPPAGEKKKALVGIDAGWAFGGSEESSGLHHEKTAFALHLGAKIEFGLSPSFGLQFRMGVQTISHGKEWRTSPVQKSKWVSNRWGLFTTSLNGVFSLKKTNQYQPYFLIGGGPCFGSLDEYSTDEFRLAFVAGGGVRFFLRPGFRSAINLEMAFHGLVNLQKPSYSYHNLGYIHLGVGVEF